MGGDGFCQADDWEGAGSIPSGAVGAGVRGWEVRWGGVGGMGDGGQEHCLATT